MDGVQVLTKLGFQEQFIRDIRRRGLPKIVTAQDLATETLETLQGIASSDRAKKKVRVGNSTKSILGLTVTEVAALIEVGATLRKPQCQAMMVASLESIFQQAIDEALGIDKPRAEYLSEAEERTAYIIKKRERLRKQTQNLTKPVLACNVFIPNNELVYGGATRDTFVGEDVAERHELCTSLEGIQMGMKLAGLDIKETVERSHSFVKKQCPDILE